MGKKAKSQRTKEAVFWLEPKVHAKLKIQAAIEETNMSELVNNLAADYVKDQPDLKPKRKAIKKA